MLFVKKPPPPPFLTKVLNDNSERKAHSHTKTSHKRVLWSCSVKQLKQKGAQKNEVREPLHHMVISAADCCADHSEQLREGEERVGGGGGHIHVRLFVSGSLEYRTDRPRMSLQKVMGPPCLSEDNLTCYCFKDLLPGPNLLRRKISF